METPAVTAVMITGKDERRIPLALASVRSFMGQTYKNKELLIVTDGFSLLPQIANAKNIREVRAERQTLGGLRNVALDNCDSPWIIQWDDDDWSHPERIEAQMYWADVMTEAHGSPRPVTLGKQIRYSFELNNAYVYSDNRSGIHGTVLHPQTDLRYETIGKHEDSHFLDNFPAVSILTSRPELYIRMQHSANTWDLRHIMRQHAKGRDRWDLTQQDADYLRQVLAENYPT